MKIAPAVGVMLAVILALVLAKECGYRAGRADAKALARDTRDDSTVSRLVHEAAVQGQRFQRERDSTGRVIRRLQAQISKRPAPLSEEPVALPDSPIDLSPSDGVPPDYQQSITVRDSLIASLLSGRAQDSLQLVYWRGLAIAYRDTLTPRLTQARDAWRREAEKPRYTLTDIGGGAIAGWGLAERNETAVLVGAGVVLAPRVVGLIKHIL